MGRGLYIESDRPEAVKANEALMMNALDGMRDSQFLGWLAMMLQEANREPLLEYAAQRLDRVALSLTAYEAIGED